MHLLPPLLDRQPDWRLPVSAAAASALVARWLGDDAGGNLLTLADSPLLLWGILHAQADGHDLESLAATFDYLATLGPASFSSGKIVPDDERLGQAAELAATSQRLAEAAVRLAEKHDDVDLAIARFYGLLWHWRDWLLWASVGQSGDWIAVPEWLAALGATDAESSEQPVIAVCTQAAHAIKDPPTKETESHQDLAADWQQDADAMPWWPALAARLARLEQLERNFEEQLETEKLEAMAEFAAGAGHEINNPVAIISGRAQLLLRDERDPERRRELASMNNQAMRVYEMISDMMLFARTPEPQCEQVELEPLVDELVDDLQDRCGQHQIKLTRADAATDVKLEADPAQLQVALRAMCHNAIEAIGRNGSIELSFEPPVESPELPAERRFVRIHVRDTGPGIPPEVRRHLFDPFFSGRQAGRGLGMGLSKCWRIAEKHHGTVAVETTPGRGTQFTLLLPVAQPPAVRVESRG